MTDGISWDELLDQAGDEATNAFKPLPDGPYDLEVVEAPNVMTKTVPSKPMWKLQAKVVGGEFNNRRVFTNIVLGESEGSVRYFFRNMGAMGLDRAYFQAKPTQDAISAALAGRRFRALVGHEEYNGDTKNTIEKFLAPTAAGTATAPAATAPPVAAAAPPPPPPPPAPVAAAPAPAPAPEPVSAGAVPPPPPLEKLPF